METIIPQAHPYLFFLLHMLPLQGLENQDFTHFRATLSAGAVKYAEWTAAEDKQPQSGQLLNVVRDL